MKMLWDNMQSQFSLPTKSTSMLAKGAVNLAEFNPSGTLIAVACKCGVIMVIDILVEKVVRWLSYFDELDIKETYFHMLPDLSTLDLFSCFKDIRKIKR